MTRIIIAPSYRMSYKGTRLSRNNDNSTILYRMWFVGVSVTICHFPVFIGPWSARVPIDSLYVLPLLTSNAESLQVGVHAENGGRDGDVRPTHPHGNSWSIPSHFQLPFQRLPQPCQVQRAASADSSRPEADTDIRVPAADTASTGQLGRNCRQELDRGLNPKVWNFGVKTENIVPLRKFKQFFYKRFGKILIGKHSFTHFFEISNEMRS